MAKKNYEGRWHKFMGKWCARVSVPALAGKEITVRKASGESQLVSLGKMVGQVEYGFVYEIMKEANMKGFLGTAEPAIQSVGSNFAPKLASGTCEDCGREVNGNYSKCYTCYKATLEEY